MHIHIDSEDRTSGNPSSFLIDLQSIGGALSRGANGKVGVKAVQIPYTWYNCRNGYNNSFRVIFSNLSSKIIYCGYSGINDLEGSPSASNMSASIIAQMNTNGAGDVFTGSINNVNGIYTITESAARSFSIIFDQDPFTYRVLGFASAGTYNSSGGVIKGTNVINVTAERWLYIKTNVPIKDGYDYDSYADNISGVICKVPVSGSGIAPFSIINYEPYNINMRDCGQFNNSVRFELVHDDNTPVNLHGINWAMTLVYENQPR